MRGLTVGSLFAGIGGLELGLERAGFGPCRWQVEIDPFCRAVLAAHWPEAERFPDVTTVGAAELAPVDLICGGFPCQGISTAGRGAGLADPRSGLWAHFARIICELRPAWVLVENSPALRSRGADRVLGDLEAAGYDWTAIVLGAGHVGAPHQRDRGFIVANRQVPGLQANRPRPAGSGPGEPDTEQPGDHVAYAPGPGCRAGAQEPGASAIAPAADDQLRGCLGDADGQGQRRGDSRGRDNAAQPAAVSAGGGLANPHLPGSQVGPGQRGDPRPELAPALRGPGPGGEWPAGPGPQHAWEPPRAVVPGLGRLPDGLPPRLAGRWRRAALHALGNAVVPQVAEVIGRAILACHEGEP